MSEGQFSVVRNDEEQFSLWPAGRALPAGWYATGVTGSEADCLAHVERVWTDIRPKSLRDSLPARQRGGGAATTA